MGTAMQSGEAFPSIRRRKLLGASGAVNEDGPVELTGTANARRILCGSRALGSHPPKGNEVRAEHHHRHGHHSRGKIQDTSKRIKRLGESSRRLVTL